MTESIKAALREYLEGSIQRRSSDPLTDTTPLAAYGIMDSLAMLELVLFIESRFGIDLSPRDLDRRHVETIERLAGLVEEKIARRNQGPVAREGSA